MRLIEALSDEPAHDISAETLNRALQKVSIGQEAPTGRTRRLFAMTAMTIFERPFETARRGDEAVIPFTQASDLQLRPRQARCARAMPCWGRCNRGRGLVGNLLSKLVGRRRLSSRSRILAIELPMAGGVLNSPVACRSRRRNEARSEGSSASMRAASSVAEGHAGFPKVRRAFC